MLQFNRAFEDWALATQLVVKVTIMVLSHYNTNAVANHSSNLTANAMLHVL